MQKIQFDHKNAKELSYQAGLVCGLYNQMQGLTGSLSKIQFLDALSKVFGYKNYANLCAVNKNQRFYFEFNVLCRSHMRAVADELAGYLEANQDTLLAAVSLAELGVQSLNEKQDNKDVVWFTRKPHGPDRLLARSKLAALYSKNAISYENFMYLYPECAMWLTQFYGLSEDDALMFDNQTWWNIADHLKISRKHKPFAFLKIQLDEHSKTNRVLYSPIWEPDEVQGEDEIGAIARHCSDGLPLTSAHESISLDLADSAYIMQCIKNWEALPQIHRVTVCIPKSLESILPISRLEILRNHIEFEDNELRRDFDHLSENDLSCDFFEFELRRKFRGGAESTLKEKWLSRTDAEKFLAVNEAIHSAQKEISESELLIFGAYSLLERHFQERIESMR